MGLDTECTWRSKRKGDEQISDAIALLRNRLLAEHLAETQDRSSEAVRNNGGLIAGIETLRGPGRSLKPLATLVEDDGARFVPDHSLLDPEEPIDNRIASRGSRVALRKALGGGSKHGHRCHHHPALRLALAGATRRCVS